MASPSAISFYVFSAKSFIRYTKAVIARKSVDRSSKILPDPNIILVVLLVYREKKWVNVGPSSCTLKVFKWVPGKFIG